MIAAKFSITDAIAKIAATPTGKEASMYGPLRDIFIHALGYPATDVDIDTTGEGGRPDVTVNAPTGILDRVGKPVKAAWIVVEAKDEPTAFAKPESRERIFAEKAKYIGAHTGWFVMADPTVLVVRLVGGSGIEQDTVLRWLEIADHQHFAELVPGLKSGVAGVTRQLARFREGDTSLIATFKLTQPDPAKATPRETVRQRLARKRFFFNLRDCTEHLQSACRGALAGVMPKAKELQSMRDRFAADYGYESVDAVQLRLCGRPQGPEASMLHTGKAVKVSVYLSDGAKSHHIPVYASLVDFLFKSGIAGASVFKGVAGVGAKHRMHSAHILEISDHLPIVIQFIETREKVDAILPELQKRATSGLIEMHEVEIIVPPHPA